MGSTGGIEIGPAVIAVDGSEPSRSWSQFTSSSPHSGQTTPASLTSGTGSPTRETPNFPDSASMGSNSGGSAGMRISSPFSGTTRWSCGIASPSGGVRAANDPGALGALDRVELALGVVPDPHGVPVTRTIPS